MNDDELIAEFTRVAEREGRSWLECLVISWPDPSEPESRWAPVSPLPAGATAEKIAAARRGLLEQLRFFRVCQRCHERNPAGWMHDLCICQTCAERHLGIVY